MGARLGAFRATYLVLLSCIGSFLFAYDTGIVGGVLTLKSFQRDMGFTAANKTQISSNSASLLQAGGECIALHGDDIVTLPKHSSPVSSCGPLQPVSDADGPLFWPRSCSRLALFSSYSSLETA
jgi:hypothetical protein